MSEMPRLAAEGPGRPAPRRDVAGRRVAIVTFGCRVNQYESEMMRRALLDARVEVTDGDADVYLLNACTVTALAERKARQAARRARRLRPGALVILIGCLADAVERGVSRFDEADLLAGNAWKARVVELLAVALDGRRGVLPGAAHAPLEGERASAPTSRARAYLKVQDGCSHACTYCRPAQVRGPSRSKGLHAALEEAGDLVRSGVPEIVVTGVDLAGYRAADGALADLLLQLLEIHDLRRLRVASLNVDGVDGPLLDAFRRDARLCRHFHIPAQSGDDAVLAAMGRPYTAATYREVAARIRDVLPDATLGTDLIVGFPGESESAFQKTCRLVEDVRFSNLHVFRFSPRPGTAAASLHGAIPGAAQRARADRVLDAWRPVLERLLDERIGTVEDVLVEERDAGSYHGYTRSYIRVAFESAEPRRVGEEAPVRIVRRSAEGLEGVSEDRDDPDGDHPA